MLLRILLPAFVWATCDPVLSSYIAFPSSLKSTQVDIVAFDPLSKSVYMSTYTNQYSGPSMVQFTTNTTINATRVYVPCSSECDSNIQMVITFDHMNRMLYAALGSSAGGTFLYRYDVASDGTLTLRVNNSLYLPLVTSSQLFWSEKNNELVCVSFQYGYDYSISLINTATWQVSVDGSSTPLVSAQIQSWLSVFDVENDLIIAKIVSASNSSFCTFVVVSLKPIGLVRVLPTNYTSNTATSELFFTYNSLNYIIFSLQDGFLLFNYSSLSDLNASSLPYVLITPASKYDNYFACAYLSQLNYVACQARSTPGAVDIFTVPDMLFVRTYEVNDDTIYSMLVADQERSLVFEVKGENGVVSLGITDLSHEICAPDVLPSYSAPLPTAACKESMPNCVPCPPGRFVTLVHPILAQPDLTARVCQDCLPGYFSENASSPECMPCPLPSFSTASAQSSCRECFPGSELSSISADNKTVHCTCAAGYRLSQFLDDLVLCEKCPSDQYKIEAGDLQCKPCPSNSAGRAGGTACTCAQGFYQDPSTANSSCLPCFSTGASCLNGVVVVSAGFWRPSVGGKPLECRPAEACGGGADYVLDNLTNVAGPLLSTCTEGYTGVLCGQCIDGWAKDSDLVSCVQCPSASPVYWATSMLVAIVMASYYVLVGSQPEKRVQRNLLGVSLAVAYAQYLAQLTVPALMHINLSFLELQPSLFSGAICPLPASVLSAWVLEMFSLPFVLLLVSLVTVIMTHVSPTKFGPEWRTRLAFSSLGVTGLLFIGQAKHLFLVLLCRDVGAESVLILDPSTACGSGIHALLSVIAVLAVLVLCVGLPMFQWMAVGGPSQETKITRRFANIFARPIEKLKSVNADFIFLSVPFRAVTPWWEAIWTLRRASIVIIASLTPLNYASRSWFMAMSILGWLALHVRLSPLLSSEYNKMESIILVVLFFSFAMEIAFHLQLTGKIVVAALLLVINIPCILYVLGTVLYQLFTSARKLVATTISRNVSRRPSNVESQASAPSEGKSESEIPPAEITHPSSSAATPLGVEAVAGIEIGSGLALLS